MNSLKDILPSSSALIFARAFLIIPPNAGSCISGEGGLYVEGEEGEEGREGELEVGVERGMIYMLMTRLRD